MLKKFADTEAFLTELRQVPEFRLKFAKSPRRLLDAVEAPDDMKVRLLEIASIAMALNYPGRFPGLLFQQDGQLPVMQQRSPKDNDEDDIETKVVFTKGRTFHSITRRDCTFQVVFRKSEREHRVTVENLEVEYQSSRDVRTQSEVTHRLEEILTGTLTTELKATLEGYGLSATQIASMTYQEIERWVAQLVVTGTIIVTVFTIKVTGQITSQEVWKTEEHWNWVGDDCGDLVLPEPEVIHSETSGPPVTYDIDTTIEIEEIHSPSVTTQGIEWAEGEAQEVVDRLIEGGVFLPEPPPASGVPNPPNIP